MTTTIAILNDEPSNVTVSAKIEESDCPTDADGKPDHGNATWPTDEEVSAEASRLLGRPVSLRFLDAGDSLLEGIWRERTPEFEWDGRTTMEGTDPPQ